MNIEAAVEALTEWLTDAEGDGIGDINDAVHKVADALSEGRALYVINAPEQALPVEIDDLIADGWIIQVYPEVSE